MDYAIAMRQRFLRFLRAKTDHLGRVPCAQVVHDGWRAPQLAAGAFALVLAYAVVALNDDLVVERERSAALAQENARLTAALDQPGVRLVDRNHRGFVCRTTRILREWERSVAASCEHLAQLLYVARAE